MPPATDTTHYLLIDGSQTGPTVLSTTTPVTVRDGDRLGDYQLTFQSDFSFLVGTAQMIPNSGLSSEPLFPHEFVMLFTQRNDTRPLVWYIMVRYLAFTPYVAWKSARANFGIIVRK